MLKKILGYNVKDEVARNIESLDSTERVVGVSNNGGVLYKKTVKYVKPANTAENFNILPSEVGMTDLTKVEKAELWMEEFYGDSITPTGLIPAPITFVTNANAWVAWYIAYGSNLLPIRLGSQYAASKMNFYFTFWYTK